MNRALIPVTVVTLFIVAIQLAILSSLRIDGVVVMLVWLWPLALGLAGSTVLAMWGAVLGGIFFDTHAATPFGLTALVGVAIAYVASRLGREGVGDVEREDRDRVERAAGGNQAGRGQGAERRLQADDAIQRRRNAA